MFRHTGGQTVGHGFYWNAGKWEVTLIERQGGVLPGTATERYARVPVLAMLVLAPIMGALYVFFLPFIGVAMVLDFLARRLWRGLRAGALGLLAAVAPAWRPGEAYLAGQDEDEPADEDEAEDDEEVRR